MLEKSTENIIINEYFLKFLKAAVSSNSPLISSGYGSPFTRVNGFISRKLKSRSVENLSHFRVKYHYFAFFEEKLSDSIWTYVQKIYENSYSIILCWISDTYMCLISSLVYLWGHGFISRYCTLKYIEYTHYEVTNLSSNLGKYRWCSKYKKACKRKTEMKINH